MMQIERVVAAARQLLALPMDDSHADLWLWEHSERVMRLADQIASLPDLANRADRTALAAAALFHDAGWVLEHQQGRYARWQLLTRPTSDLQRELGAALLQEHAGHLLPAPVVRLATEAIRFCNDRGTRLLEAQILADAENTDEMGLVYVFRQFRQYQAEGRPMQQIMDSWQRQKEYSYWDVRLSGGFHFTPVREVARQRLAVVERFLAALAHDLRGDDLARLVGEPGGPRAGD